MLKKISYKITLKSLTLQFMISGMSFHSLGAQTEKARSPQDFNLERGIANKFLLDDRKHLLGLKVSNKSLI